MNRVVFSFVFSAASFALVSCDRALVYGERTGFNLAVRSDVAESAPLEVNAGLQRRIVGFVPAKGGSDSQDPEGEAVNMVSRFELTTTPNNTSSLSNTVTIKSTFASGEAARSFGENEVATNRLLNLEN